MRPYGIAATLCDAVALTTSFGAGATIGIGAANASGADILAPESLILQSAEAAFALAVGHSKYIFTFGNTGSAISPAMSGPVMDLLANRSGTDFLATCLATPWSGCTVYQGHLFRNGRLEADLKRELSPYIDGAIAILPLAVVAQGVQAIRNQLTAMKERGVRLALLDAIEEEHCSAIAEALAAQPVIAGPAWLSPACSAIEGAGSLPDGPIAMLSGALDRQIVMQTAIARRSMPVLDLDLRKPRARQIDEAMAWATPYFGKTPFLISSTAPPDQVRPGAQAAETLASIAEALAGAGIRNFLLAGNDTAAIILSRLGITQLTASTPFAGLRWLQGENLNILIKPGGFGSKNLFLYDFEPQSRLNATAE